MSDEPVSVFICSRGQRRRRCSLPGCNDAGDRLCDFPLVGTKTGKTCDRAICQRHATAQGPDRDYCPVHAKQEPLIR